MQEKAHACVREPLGVGVLRVGEIGLLVCGNSDDRVLVVR